MKLPIRLTDLALPADIAEVKRKLDARVKRHEPKAVFERWIVTSLPSRLRDSVTWVGHVDG